MYSKRISIDNKILFGKAHIKKTRISVEQVLACLSEGWEQKKIMKEFGISKEDIKACIDYAYHSVARVHILKISNKEVYA